MSKQKLRNIDLTRVVPSWDRSRIKSGRGAAQTLAWTNISASEGHWDGVTLGIWGDDCKLVVIRAASLNLISIHFPPR